MNNKTLREAAQELVENKGPCLDGVVRHVGEHYVEALIAALANSGDARECVEDDEWVGFPPPKSVIEALLRYPDWEWEVLNIDHLTDHDYRIVRVAPTVDKTMVIWIKDNANASEGPWKVRNHDEIEGYYEVYNSHDFDIPRRILQGKPQASDFCDALNRLDAQQER